MTRHDLRRAPVIAMCLALAACAGHPVAPVASPRARGDVATDRGVVRGQRVDDSTFAFRGIPYAAPPVGALRFRPPEPAAPWQGAREAIRFAAACPQLDKAGAQVGSEDCLALNVWTPALAPGEPLPVLVFIHGGANMEGSTSDLVDGKPVYDGAQLAERAHAVVVTIQYRLGALGFLVAPALANESEHHASGNYALLDQIAALRWVNRNIRGFGGDPTRVMVFGQSAGAHDTCALLASPLAAGLFSRAMMMSERCSVPPAAKLVPYYARVVAAVGCAQAEDVAACVRAVPLKQLIEAVPGSFGVGAATSSAAFAYELNVDGWVLRESPLDALAAGHANSVPLIVGNTAHETSLQISQLPEKIHTAADYEKLVHTLYGPALANRVLAVYPVTEFANPFAAAVKVTTDQRFVCPARRIAKAHGHAYRYVFGVARDHAPFRAYGAFHAIDIHFLFRRLDTANERATRRELEASDRFIRYVASFAATGDPNAARTSDVSWPQSGASGDVLVLGEQARVAAGYDATQCDFWDEASR